MHANEYFPQRNNRWPHCLWVLLYRHRPSPEPPALYQKKYPKWRQPNQHDAFYPNMKADTKWNCLRVAQNAANRYWHWKHHVSAAMSNIDLGGAKQIFQFILLAVTNTQEKKKGIFDRLEQEKSSTDQTFQITAGLAGKPISSSIFSRLGGKSENEEEIDAAFAGIFKSAPKKVNRSKVSNLRNFH